MASVMDVPVSDVIDECPPPPSESPETPTDVDVSAPVQTNTVAKVEPQPPKQMHIDPIVMTVPKEMLVKHPLQYRWVLWYCKAEWYKDWPCLNQVTPFDTVEDFWALYNKIQLASGLQWGSDYYVFKEGIKPMWEDDHNIQCGRWLVMVKKEERGEKLDHYWLELLMAMVGEMFDDHGEQICGAVVNIRQKGDKISLWTRDACKDEANEKIGKILKAKLGTKDTLRYECHKDTSHKAASMVKAKITV